MLNKVLHIVFLLLTIYLSIAFMVWDLDPGSWDSYARSVAVVVLILAPPLVKFVRRRL
jgi:hypothetical protein